MPFRTFTAAIAAALTCALLAPATALAAGAADKDPYGEQTPLALPADGGSSKADAVAGGGGSLARTLIGLAVVIAVIYGLTWVLRQMKASKHDRASGSGLVSEASIPLGAGRSVHLIRAGRELVLVGSAEHGVVPIRTYTEAEARELGLLDAGGQVPDAVTGTSTAGPRPLHGAVNRLRALTAR